MTIYFQVLATIYLLLNIIHITLYWFKDTVREARYTAADERDRIYFQERKTQLDKKHYDEIMVCLEEIETQIEQAVMIDNLRKQLPSEKGAVSDE